VRWCCSPYKSEKADAFRAGSAAAEEADDDDDSAAANQRHGNSVNDHERRRGIVLE